ncbi:MAG TPA: ATP synthase subunit I [Pirellulales bacterium]|nr:ATP synthase subunit I [Pirellulales bacterium]
MNWLAAMLIGATVALAYCASLWLAIGRTVGRSHPIVWFGFGSAARLVLVTAAFYGLTILGAEVALWALVGFAAARSGLTYWVGRPR